MNMQDLLKTCHTSIEAAYNGFGIRPEELGILTVSDVADLLLEDARIESDTLFPTKVRANRRRQTAKKHHRLDTINSYHYTGEEVKHEYKMKSNAKKSASRAKMNKRPDLRKFKDYDFTESLADYEYQRRVDEFYKLVEQFNTDDDDFFFYPDECFPFEDDDESDIRKKFKSEYLDWLAHNDNDMPEFVDEKRYPFDGMSNVSKAIWDFFNVKA